MPELTEQQALFAREYARNGGRGADAARKAGFSERSAGKYAYQLLEKTHVLAAIQREQRRAFTELASISLEVVREMLTNPRTPASARADLAKTVFDRSGLAAIKADEESAASGERSLNELSLSELLALAASLKLDQARPAGRPAPVLVGEASIAAEAERAPAIDGE